MLSDQLREETESVHQELEKRLIARVKSITTAQDYEALLRLFYGFYSGLEERMEKAIDHSRLQDYPLRRKSALLLEDLHVFNTNPPKFIPVQVDLPEINDHFEAMGALYVLECATLGGKVVINLVKEKLGLKNKSGLAFFRGYAEETWQKWELFRKSLNILPRNSPEALKVVAAATDTFQKFTHWINEVNQMDSLN